MPQVNVYIPDDLAEMLPRYREALNLSQICAQAMRQAIQKLEAANQAPGRVNTQRVLDRLRDQQQRQSAAYQDGAGDAAHWLEEEALLEEIRRYGAWEPGINPGSFNDSAFDATFFNGLFRGRSEITLDDFYARAFRPKSFELTPRYRSREEAAGNAGVNLDEYWPAYRKGWHETVIAAWTEIKDQL
ncbi:MAG: hypothetical protein ACR2JY_07270 [Chloroflexota bacterium]